MKRHLSFLSFLFISSVLFLSVGSVVNASKSLRSTEGAVRGQNHVAKKFGVYEVMLHGNGTVDNPFDTVARVTFTPPSGSNLAKTVFAFYDGHDIWRARVYVSEPGTWKWICSCETDSALDGRSGIFEARESNLPGRLLIHPRNPRQWMTENGRWFLNLNDTTYFLLCTHDAIGNEIPFEDFTAYVRDAVAKGITSFRSFAVCGPKGFRLNEGEMWVDAFVTDADFTRFHLDQFQNTDRRLRWLLDNYPNVCVQLILFPRGSKWKEDETFWKAISDSCKERVLRWMIARYAAYPQIFWLVVNDAHYGPEYPNNNAYAREVGAYFHQHDPWKHPLSTGHARKVPFYFGTEDWATYLHLEDNYNLDASAYEPYHPLAKPVFLGEDRYEQDRVNLDPEHMRYYQRRLFWAWLLSGGSANYGGRWWVLHPYSQTGQRSTTAPWRNPTPFTAPLTGLDSIPYIKPYFQDRRVELSDFEPDHALVSDPDVRNKVRAPKLMRRGMEEFLVYHPNAAADDKAARCRTDRTPWLRLNLSAAKGTYKVEWYRPKDGVALDGSMVKGGAYRDLVSPWEGVDVVLRLVKTNE